MAGGPLFSVVIPTFNRAERAAAAVRSVLAQTDPDFECLVVDDGSQDDTVARLKRLKDSRLRLSAKARNRGQHACRNEAIREARGEWIAFLDDDDLYMPERLAALRRAIASRPETGFWYTNAWVHRDGRVVGTLFDPGRELPQGRLPGYYAVGDERLPYVTTLVAIRREAFGRIGFFREDLKILEDTELYARMLGAGLEVGSIGRPLAVRFLHESQITRDHLRDFSESLEALRAGDPPAPEFARLRRRAARDVAGYLLKALRPADARGLLRAELGGGALRSAVFWASWLPRPALAAAKSLRAAWLRARHHPAFAGPDKAAVYRFIDQMRSA